jgi:hypothetical protein
MHRSRQGRRAIAGCAAVAVVGLMVAISGSTRVARADTGSSRGTISGSGAIDVAGETTAVSVSASFTGSVVGGSFTIVQYPTGTPSPSPTPSEVLCLWITGSNAVVGGMYHGLPVFVFIADGGPSGPDTLEVSPQEFGPDCTVGPIGPNPTVLSSGDFTIGDASADTSPADGIADSLQPSGTAAGSFVDGSVTPPTYGSIVANGGLVVRVSDAPAPDGVQIVVGSGAVGAQAELSICGFGVVLDAYTQTTVTCGSITLRVAAGTATVLLGGGTTAVSVPAGGAGKVTDTGGGTFSVANVGDVGSPSVSITVGGTTTEVPAGATATAGFIGFSQPIDNEPVLNRVKAGQAIPVKWRLVNGAGAPITNVTSASITVSALDCALAGSVDQVEEVATGSSGLQNLGNGYYQINWKSPTTYAGSCKTLHLSVAGARHDALFQFTR